jgi:Family of unknown function (DUF6807)
MRKFTALGLLAASTLLTASALAAPAAKGVQVVADEAQHRVDITIDGQPFTSYIWPATLKKPVLYPLIDGDGVTLTRGYPLEPRPGERVDHPHHAGLWFNYSNVNGFDFWNNSDAIPPARRAKMGSIDFKKIVSTRSGPNRGELVTESTWVTGAGEPIIDETTRLVFSSIHGARVIDRIATLHALDHVVFHDDKDGLLGLRVASWLESPTAEGGVFTDAHGVQTKVSGASPDATGVYLTSEGVKGDAAWGTRGRWCTLTGHTGNHTATIAIFDNPKNPGYPTYWHARGYGLFAVNPLAPSSFDRKQPPLNFTLEKGQTATFRYRIVLYNEAVTPEQLNREADAFAAQYK